MNITEEIARKVLETVDVGLVKGVGSPIPGEMCVEAAVCYAMDLPHSDDPPCVSRALRMLKTRLNDCDWSSPQARARGMRRLAVAQLGSRDVFDDQEFARRVALHVVNCVVPRALRFAVPFLERDEIESLDAAIAACQAAKDLPAAREAAEAAAHMMGSTSPALDAPFDAMQTVGYAASAVRVAADRASTDAAAYAAFAARSAANTAACLALASVRTNDAKAAVKAGHDAEDEQLSMFAEEIVQILVDMNAPGVQFLHLTQ